MEHTYEYIVKLDRDEVPGMRMQVCVTANLCAGVPYKFGAKPHSLTSLPKALDCSGLVSYAFNANRLYIPMGSQGQYHFCLPTKNPEKGDLAFFGHGRSDARIYHVGIFLGDGRIIEARDYDDSASFPTGKVIYRPAEAWEKWRNFVGYRSLPVFG